MLYGGINMALYNSVAQLVGNTPMLKAANYCRAEKVCADILLKLEYFNPAGSVKDRVALAMIEDAERRGKLKAGGVIVEPTSGNTGIGLAAIGAARGYRVVLTMPESMSVERVKLIEAYGAEVVLTDGALGMQGAIDKANQLATSINGAYMAGQFENFANPAAHRAGTGPEIWNDTQGKIDFFVAGVGTGGTLSGAGGFLKQQNPELKVIAVEPKGSPYLSKCKSGAHNIQGIGAGFVPKVLNTKIYDKVVAVDDESAHKAMQRLARTEGIFAGLSSGAALCAATEIARRVQNAGKTVVVVLPDTGERYLSII